MVRKQCCCCCYLAYRCKGGPSRFVEDRRKCCFIFVVPIFLLALPQTHFHFISYSLFTHLYLLYSSNFLFCLDRELNELRKPSSDNIEILRFFRYMRAAKDGQDGNNCQDIYSKCTEFNANDGPAMINTYNDINKLVQARKF